VKNILVGLFAFAIIMGGAPPIAWLAVGLGLLLLIAVNWP
jgi:hypothetical protein